MDEWKDAAEQWESLAIRWESIAYRWRAVSQETSHQLRLVLWVVWVVMPLCVCLGVLLGWLIFGQ